MTLVPCAAGFKFVADVLLQATDEVARKLRLGKNEVERIFDSISAEILSPPETVLTTQSLGSESFTTGDDGLDDLLGSGIKTGSVWEITGEGLVSSFLLRRLLRSQE